MKVCRCQFINFSLKHLCRAKLYLARSFFFFFLPPICFTCWRDNRHKAEFLMSCNTNLVRPSFIGRCLRVHSDLLAATSDFPPSITHPCCCSRHNFVFVQAPIVFFLFSVAVRSLWVCFNFFFFSCFHRSSNPHFACVWLGAPAVAEWTSVNKLCASRYLFNPYAGELYSCVQLPLTGKKSASTEVNSHPLPPPLFFFFFCQVS